MPLKITATADMVTKVTVDMVTKVMVDMVTKVMADMVMKVMANMVVTAATADIIIERLSSASRTFLTSAFYNLMSLCLVTKLVPPFVGMLTVPFIDFVGLLLRPNLLVVTHARDSPGGGTLTSISYRESWGVGNVATNRV